MSDPGHTPSCGPRLLTSSMTRAVLEKCFALALLSWAKDASPGSTEVETHCSELP